jgi:DNA-binding transcriptional regulator PaaX
VTGQTTRPEGLTADSWQEWPHNRWAFQHIEEVLRTATVPRGGGPLLALTDGERLDPPGLDAELRACCTDGLILLRGDEIRLERYLNGMSSETRHLLMSVSKSITSAVFGRYVSRGEVDVRETVSRYIAALEGSAYGDATVQQTLDMTVAVAYDEEYDDPQSAVQRHDRSGRWRASRPGDPAGVREFLTTLRKDGDHGRAFRYCSANTDVLAWILEEASGRPFSELLSSELWAALGAQADAFATVDGEGFVFANAGVCATLRDLGEHAARATLSRMVRRNLLRRHTAGRRSYFGLTAFGSDTLIEGRERAHDPRPDDAAWDEEWTFVAYSLPEEAQRERHELRATLTWAGFGMVQSGLWAAPRHVDVASLVTDPAVLSGLRVIQGRPQPPSSAPELVRRAFDVTGLEARHAGFVLRWRPVADVPLSQWPDPLVARTVLATDWLQVIRDDPRLPSRFLGAKWTGTESRQLYLDLDTMLRPATEEQVRTWQEVRLEPEAARTST